MPVASRTSAVRACWSHELLHTQPVRVLSSSQLGNRFTCVSAMAAHHFDFELIRPNENVRIQARPFPSVRPKSIAMSRHVKLHMPRYAYCNYTNIAQYLTSLQRMHRLVCCPQHQCISGRQNASPIHTHTLGTQFSNAFAAHAADILCLSRSLHHAFDASRLD